MNSQNFRAPAASRSPMRRSRMELASRPLVELLFDDVFRKTLEIVAADTPEARKLFAERFWSARDRGEDFGKWFIRERFIALTGALGGDEHILVGEELIFACRPRR